MRTANRRCVRPRDIESKSSDPISLLVEFFMRRSGLLLSGLALVTVTAITTSVCHPAAGPAAAPKAAASPVESVPALTSLRGADIPVRKVGEAKFTGTDERVGVEAYRDEDFGNLLYVTHAGSIAVMPQPDNFQLRELPFEDYYETIRFASVAGVAWRLNLKTGKWQTIEEPKPILPGNYDVDMFHISDTKMVVFRIEKLTGRTWSLVTDDKKPDEWVEIAEPDKVVAK
jgi:hypothetical protein